MRKPTLSLFYFGLWASSVLVLWQGVECKIYLRCELARKLRDQYSFDRSLLSNWICLLEHESELDTTKETREENGSINYGLFQINSAYCQEARPGRFCNVACEKLKGDNLAESVECAKKIQAERGFRNWKGWKRFCSNPQNLPDLKVACGI
ncbi:lysozyme [Scaptodrosophila lebanonensis]|uniref:lysozyme n=1 Tax=Drosophila lebanonensis TaxID=7225 RepID=A0A6J2U520_DROLE|nr:lysozyme [Scaptodrosophila lebanonensis]